MIRVSGTNRSNQQIALSGGHQLLIDGRCIEAREFLVTHDSDGWLINGQRSPCVQIEGGLVLTGVVANNTAPVPLGATCFAVLGDGVMLTETGLVFEYTMKTASWNIGEGRSAEKICLRASVEATQAASAQRLRRIREHAYQVSERRGFLAGYAINDWLMAERTVDEDILSRRRRLRSIALARQAESVSVALD